MPTGQFFYTFKDPLDGDVIESLLLMIYNNKGNIGELSKIQESLKKILNDIDKIKKEIVDIDIIDGGEYN